MRLSRALPLLALASLVACSDQKPNGAANNIAPGNNASVEVANATGTLASSGNMASSPDSSISGPAAAFDRLGAIRIGATLKELERDGLKLAGRDEPLDEESTCTYATFRDQPDIAVMLDGERIARIDVNGGEHETMGGVRVGQSEADAVKRLGGKAKVEPHPYTGPEGHYLVVHDGQAPRGLIVETDGKTVQSWRIGQWEQVQWIEGCA